MNRSAAVVLVTAMILAALAYARAMGAPLTPPLARQVVSALNDGTALVFGEGSSATVAVREVAGRLNPECQNASREVRERRGAERAHLRKLQADAVRLIDSAIALLPELLSAVDIAREFFTDPLNAIEHARELVASLPRSEASPQRA